MTSSGVLVRRKIGSANMIPAIERAMPATSIKMKKEEKARCTLSYCLAPKNCETTTEVPLPTPITSDIIK